MCIYLTCQVLCIKNPDLSTLIREANKSFSDHSCFTDKETETQIKKLAQGHPASNRAQF